MKKDFEQELKMALNEREYNILLGVAKVEPYLQTNHYFRYDGMPKELMIRLRIKGDRYILGYKRRLSHSYGIAVSDERECEVSSDFAQSMLNRGITAAELNQLLGVRAPSDAYYIGSMNTYRAKFDIENWTLELDRSEYAGKVDYELECENLYVEQLEKLKNYLFYTYGIIFRQAKPKIQRFLDALSI